MVRGSQYTAPFVSVCLKIVPLNFCVKLLETVEIFKDHRAFYGHEKFYGCAMGM